MSADIVNLRLARKAKARAEASAKAAENRARFGRSKGERAESAQEAGRLAAAVEGAKRERTDGLA